MNAITEQKLPFRRKSLKNDSAHVKISLNLVGRLKSCAPGLCSRDNAEYHCNRSYDHPCLKELRCEFESLLMETLTDGILEYCRH